MGIRGFDSFLRHRCGGDEIRFDAAAAGDGAAPALAAPPLPSHHLVVDANGLAHFLFAERSVDFWCGGDFTALAAAVAWFVAPFRRNGVRLLCVFDGAREPGKAATQRERRDGKAEVFSRIMHQLETECDQQPSRVGIGASARCFCLPFLALRALSQALQSHDHVAVVFAHGEGDTDAARLCAHMPCRGVIAQDSDFFFYALSPVTPSSSAANEAVYIPFDSLRFVASESHAGGVDIVATSFARSRVCAALGLRDDKSGAALLRSIGTGSARGNGNNNGNGSGSGAEAVALPELPALACLVGNDVTLHLPWLAAFHDRLHALPALASCFRGRRRSTGDAHHPHDVIKAVVQLLVLLRSPKHADSGLLQRLLFGSHSSSDWRRQQFGALLGAIAQYDVHATPSHFLKHALAALPPAWRLSHEIAAAVAAEVLVAPPVACDGRAIHPALVDAHTRGDFCSEWWTVLCHAEHWLPLHLAGARRPLHDALARVRLRAYSLLFCRDADTAAAQCIADEDTNANAASASVNDRDSLEAGLCALSLTGSAVPLPLPTSPPPPPPPRPVVAATASATASAQSAAQSASQKRRARKKRAKQVQAVDSASNDAVATLSPSSIALHADSPPLAAAASDDDADDDVCDNNATLDLKQSVPSFALVSSSASRGNAVSRPVTVTLVTEHGAWRVGSKAQVRLKSRPGCVPSSFHRRDDDPNDCDRPLYMSALDGHLSLCERRRIALSVFDLDQKNYSDSDRRELPGTADAQFIIALAACMQLHTGVVDGDAGATDDVGDDTWSSLVAPCAFIMSSALFQSSLHSSDRASSADHLAAFTESSLSMDLDSLDAVFSADAQQAAHALHSMLELVLPVNALLAWPFGGALPLERYLGDGVTLHRCVRALQKQQRQQQPAPSAERLADATAAQTRERGSNGPSEIAAMRDMMRRASAALGQSAAAAASEPEVERLLSLWAMLR